MKKLSFLLLTGLAVLNGCTSEEDPIPQFETAEGATETTYTRSVADAIALADAFLDAGNDKVESRAGRTPKVAAILGATSRSESDTLLYSVNYGEDDGFVIVSATATPQPVLAYVEKGSYDGEPTQNPGFEAFIDAAKSYSTYSYTGPIDSVLKPAPRPYTIYKVAKPANLTKWGQDYPEGVFCPNGHSGCVQTAIAQAFAIIEKPLSIALTYPGADKNSLSLNWSEIKTHKLSDELQPFIHRGVCDASADAHSSISYLCRQLGHLNNATYNEAGKKETSVTMSSALNTLRNLLGSNKVSDKTSISTGKNKLFNNLYSRKSVAIVSGTITSNAKVGHVWLCEGGRSYEYHSGMPQYKDDDFSEPKEFVSQTYYFYFNWGDCGENDGYFLGDVYDTSKYIAEEDLPKPINPVLELNDAALSRADYKYNVEYIMIYK